MDPLSHSQLDPFFFASSPLFSGGHSDSSSYASSEEPEMMFLDAPPTQAGAQMKCTDQGVSLFHQPKQQQQPAEYAVDTGLAILTQSRGVSDFDWSRMDQHQQQHHHQDQVPIVQDVSLHVDHRRHHSPASCSSSSEHSGHSGHSTPTLPLHQSTAEQQMIDYHQQQQMLRQQMLQSAPMVAPIEIRVEIPAPSSQPSAQQLSLLEQFSVTIPQLGLPSVLGPAQPRTLVKVKRERGTKSKKATNEPALLSSQQALPTFVSSAMPYPPSASLTHSLSVPSVTSPHHGGGYSSDSSHPSLHSVPSHSRATSAQTHVAAAAGPTHQDMLLDESNEPSMHDDDETKRRKLSRKAELARLARKRKKTRLGDLEAEVARLEEELARVKRGKVETRPAEEAPDKAADKMYRAVGGMIQAVHSGQVKQQALLAAQQRTSSLTGSDAVSRSSPTPLTPLIDEFMVAYNASQAECAQHIETLQQQHLKPMRTFEFLSWLMKQSHESHGSVWSSLLGRELSLSPSSREYRELECFRQSMSSQHNFDGEIERAFTKMAQLFTKRATQHAKNLNRIRSILDEPQFCAMVEWMNRDHHQAAVKMEA